MLEGKLQSVACAIGLGCKWVDEFVRHGNEVVYRITVDKHLFDGACATKQVVLDVDLSARHAVIKATTGWVQCQLQRVT